MVESKIIFCPKCNNEIRSFRKKGDKMYGKCINNHETKLDASKTRITFTIKKEKKHFEEIIIIRHTEEFENKVSIMMSCPYCDSEKCKLLYSFASREDEESVHLIKCLKCKKAFRLEYDG